MSIRGNTATFINQKVLITFHYRYFRLNPLHIWELPVNCLIDLF